jgi:hypothetical protein
MMGGGCMHAWNRYTIRRGIFDSQCALILVDVRLRMSLRMALVLLVR